MNPQVPNLPVQTQNGPKSFFNPLSIFAFIIIFIFYSVILLYVSSKYGIPLIMGGVNSKKIITESESPVSIDLLRNSVVYQWRGSVEGTLTDKNKTTFTITKTGSSIIIPIDSIMTKFFGTIKEDRTRDYLKLEDIPTGTFVRGEFWTIPGKKDEIIGGQFYLDNKVKKQ